MTNARTTLFLVLATGCSGLSASDPISTSSLPPTTDPYTPPTTPDTTTGSTSDTSTPPPPCYDASNLKDALTNASNGDTLLVCPGTHQVTLTITKNIVLAAQDPTQPTVLDGAGAGTVIGVQDTGQLLLRDLQITGGVSAPDAFRLVIENCEIYDNTGFVGGVQGPFDDETELRDTVIRNNEGTFAGGLAIGTGLLERVDVLDNISTGNAGGIWLYPFQGPTVSEVLVQGNSADGIGGGVALDWSSFWLGGVIEENSAAYGGGIGLLNVASTAVQDATVRNNTATVAGGGFYNEVTIGGFTQVNRVDFEGNDAPLGGGMYLQDTLDSAIEMQLTDVSFDGNTATEGAGLAATGVPIVATGGAFFNNAATADGGALWLQGGATFEGTTVDLGSGATDNTPEDIDLTGTDYLYDGLSDIHCDAICQPI